MEKIIKGYKITCNGVFSFAKTKKDAVKEAEKFKEIYYIMDKPTDTFIEEIDLKECDLCGRLIEENFFDDICGVCEGIKQDAINEIEVKNE